MADVLNCTYDIGYHSCCISECIGQNMFFWYHDSARPHPTLLEGPGEAASYPYACANFADIGMPVGEAKVRGIGMFVEQFSLWLDPIVHNALKSLLNKGSIMEQGLCRIGILTQGISNVCFSFANDTF